MPGVLVGVKRVASFLVSPSASTPISASADGMRIFAPKWLTSRLVVYVVMLAAGFWRLDRLDARKASSGRSTRPQVMALPVEDLLAQVVTGQDVVDQTAVTATGRFLDEPGLLMANHLRHRAGLSERGAAELDDSRIVLVSEAGFRATWRRIRANQIEAVDGQVTSPGVCSQAWMAVGSGAVNDVPRSRSVT